MDFPGRINQLVERFFGGVVSKAASAWGVHQPTVHRWLAGEAKSPRAYGLLPIAEYHGTSMEWLLTGEGPNPLDRDPYPMVEYHDWDEQVRRLELPPDVARAVLALPSTTLHAHSILCRWGSARFTMDSEESPGEKQGWKALWLAQAQELAVWAQFLESLVRAFGRDRVRDKLVSEEERILLGFHPVAMSLLNEPTVVDRLHDTIKRLRPRPEDPSSLDGPTSVVENVGDPQLPPLNDPVGGSGTSPLQAKPGRPRVVSSYTPKKGAR